MVQCIWDLAIFFRAEIIKSDYNTGTITCINHKYYCDLEVLLKRKSAIFEHSIVLTSVRYISSPHSKNSRPSWWRIYVTHSKYSINSCGGSFFRRQQKVEYCIECVMNWKAACDTGMHVSSNKLEKRFKLLSYTTLKYWQACKITLHE